MRKWQRMAARLGAGVLAALLAGVRRAVRARKTRPAAPKPPPKRKRQRRAHTGCRISRTGQTPLRRLQCADEQAYFEIEYIDGEIGRLCVTDFTTGQRRVPALPTAARTTQPIARPPCPGTTTEAFMC